MGNAAELRNELTAVYNNLKAGKIKPGEAEAYTNIAGKIIASALSQVKYYALRKEVPTIKFLQDDSKNGA